MEVVADHRRHVAVRGLVVGHPRADGIGQRDPSLAVHLEEAGHAQRRVGPEHRGVEEVVVDAPVDDIDLLAALRRSHPHAPVLDVEVSPLDELDAHLLREEGVLEVGAVVQPRRQHDDGGLLEIARGEAPQHLEERGGVVLDRAHSPPLEEPGKGARHDHPVGQHVADPARRAQVVLEHHVAAVVPADDVDAADVRVHVVGQLDAVDFAAERGIGQHELPRDHAVVEDLRLVVDVAQEKVERADALNQPRLDERPLVRGNHAREEVEGEGALGAGLVAVDRERDALVPEGQVRERPAPPELDRGHRPDPFRDVGVVRAGCAVGLEHLVEEALRVVVAEHGPPSAAGLARSRHGAQRVRASRLSGAPLSRVRTHSEWSRAPIRL